MTEKLVIRSTKVVLNSIFTAHVHDYFESKVEATYIVHLGDAKKKSVFTFNFERPLAPFQLDF